MRKLLQQHKDELEEKAEALQLANNELQQFASVVAHDLKVPLNSIHPPQLVLGLARSPSEKRWRLELAARLVAAKSAADLDNRDFAQFEAPGYEVFDLFGAWKLTDRLAINAGLLNLLDEAYWTWANARGLKQNSTVLMRHTEAGREAVVSLRYRR